MTEITLPTNCRFRNLTGEIFDKITVSRFGGRNQRGEILWVCECDCGKVWLVVAGRLRRIKSCGHEHKGPVKTTGTKGMTHTLTYRNWHAIIQRCTQLSNKSYCDYGAIGITVCERWLDFRNFLADMGERPSKIHSIDRLPGATVYCKENCRWATPLEQARNRSSNHLIEYNGQVKCIAEWAEEIGTSPLLLRQQIYRDGKSFEQVYSSSIWT